MLRDNTGPGGSLDTDKFMRAVLQYRSNPMQDCRRSPAQIVFGRQMRDFIPSLTYKYEPAKDCTGPVLVRATLACTGMGYALHHRVRSALL